MDDQFAPQEKLFRAIYPPEIAAMYWRRDGSLSSAAFADPRGLSVDREGDRTPNEVIIDMQKRFTGVVVYVRTKNCTDIGACVRYLPSAGNPYHSEIHGSKTQVPLSKQQRLYLSRKAIVAVTA